jgi:Leucine-rich repeat (LRR) protein
VLLDLSRNELKTLPRSLGDLTQLKKLKLATNKFERLPLHLSRLLGLEELHLGRNPLIGAQFTCFTGTKVQILTQGEIH